MTLCKKIEISSESARHLIGKGGRNLYLVNALLEPGHVILQTKEKIVSEDRIDYVHQCAELELHGPCENHNWCKKALRIVRSARRGGIIKWFDRWNRQKFNTNTEQKWLKKIRNWEHCTDCKVEQLQIPYKGESYEVWLILENSRSSHLEKAIDKIGKCIHKRFKILT